MRCMVGLVIFSVLLALSNAQEEKRDILNDIGSVAGKIVGKAWRTVMPKDIVEGAVAGAQDKQFHGQPEGPPGGGYPGFYPPPGYNPYYPGGGGFYPPPAPVNPYYY